MGGGYRGAELDMEVGLVLSILSLSVCKCVSMTLILIKHTKFLLITIGATFLIAYITYYSTLSARSISPSNYNGVGNNLVKVTVNFSTLQN
jgi:hypothetical protein